MKLRSIQLLRAVAIILVVYAHSIDLQMIFGHSFQQDFLYLQNFGAFGVDLFFVVSGFVISMVAVRYSGVKQGFRFLARRFIRLNPVYYLVSGLSFLLLLHWPLTINNLFSHAGNLRKTLLLLPFFDSVLWVNPLLFVGWTLSFEWLFYIQFFMAILCAPRKKEWLIALLITGMVGLGIVFKSGDPRWIFLTSPIQLEFLFGAIIYRLYALNVQADRAKAIARVCLVTGVGICVYLIVVGFGEDLEMFHLFNGDNAFSRLLHWATASGLIVAGFTFMEKSNREKHSPVKPGKVRKKMGAWLLLCGDASYSIYLTHLPVFTICRTAYSKLGFPLDPDLAVFTQLALALLIGILFYKWVESPLLNWLRTLFRLQ